MRVSEEAMTARKLPVRARDVACGVVNVEHERRDDLEACQAREDDERGAG